MAKRNDDDEPMSHEDRMTRIETMLANLAALAMQGNNDSTSQQLAAILEKVTGSQERTAELIEKQAKRQVRPSNEVVPMHSVFNPRGELLEDWRKPRLACEMHWTHRVEDETSTIEEVELLNLLLEAGSGAYIIKRNDDSKIKITVKCDGDEMGRVYKMVWMHDTAFRNEYFRTLPPMRVMLRQMLAQCPPHIAKKAHGVLTMEDWEAMAVAEQKAA